MQVSSQRITTPVSKEKAVDMATGDVLVDESTARVYRSVAMRVAYLSMDRPDLQQGARELAKGLKTPTDRHWTALKRIARYLKNRPRLVQEFPYQTSVGNITVWADTDHAGCIRTRKSTTGGAVLMGKCTIHTYSKGQAVIALSSGEAEYYGLVSGISQVLGMVSMARDWGMSLKAHAWMDATAGIAIGSRRGLGKVKHIDTVFLWAQEVVNSGRVTVGKKDTKEMLADMLTKPVPGVTMEACLAGMGYRFQEGKHELGLKA